MRLAIFARGREENNHGVHGGRGEIRGKRVK
jgi:hypothetical protein